MKKIVRHKIFDKCKIHWVGFITLILLFNSCDDYFEYSPYSANVDSKYRNTTSKELIKLKASGNEKKDSFKVAIVADSHYWYHELDEALVNINSRNDIDFVICAGDIADHGQLKEYELFHETMKRLRVPYFTVIGNHDYRSNGGEVYGQMFGERNYSFEYNNCSFIFFDNVILESNQIPDFAWLEEEINEDQNEMKVVVSHLPPFAIEFDLYRKESERIVEILSNGGASLSIHGHVHNYSFKEHYEDGVDYLTIDAANKKGYGIVTFYNDNTYRVERIKY